MFFCCCNSCLKFSDDFSDPSTLGNEPVFFPFPISGSGNWHEIANAGRWSVSGGTAHTSTNGDHSNYLYLDQSNFNVYGSWHCKFDFSVSGGSGWVNGLEFTTTKIRVANPGPGGGYLRECNWGGSGTIIYAYGNHTIVGGQQSQVVEIYVNDVPLWSMWSGGGGLPHFWKTGAAGTVTLDNFSYWWNDLQSTSGGFGSPPLVYAHCPPGPTNEMLWPMGVHDEITLEISNAVVVPMGGLPVTPNCTCCGSLNGTYVMSGPIWQSAVFGNPAFWRYEVSSPCACGGNAIWVSLESGGYTLYVCGKSYDLSTICGNGDLSGNTTIGQFGSGPNGGFCNFDFVLSV